MSERESDLVREVFARVRNQDPRVADLYRVDATLTAGGTVHTGRDAIREFYLSVFNGPRPPHPTVRGMWQAGSTYVALVEVQLGGDAVIHAVDLFDLEDNGIRAMRISLGGLDPGWVPIPANTPAS